MELVTVLLMREALDTRLPPLEPVSLARSLPAGLPALISINRAACQTPSLPQSVGPLLCLEGGFGHGCVGASINHWI